MSDFGRWTTADGLPVFEGVPVATDGGNSEHLVSLGNRRLQLVASTAGTRSLWDEFDGLRWLLAPQPGGTGTWTARVDGGEPWGTGAPGPAPVRSTFGPTWHGVDGAHDGVAVEQVVLCPEGEAPWCLVRVRVTVVGGGGARRIELRQSWTVRPRFVDVFTPVERADELAAANVRYRVTATGGRAVATEERVDGEAEGGAATPGAFGAPATLVFEAFDAGGTATSDGEGHPTVTLSSEVEVAAGETRELWFRFGLDDGSSVPDPAGLWAASLDGLRERLPTATSPQAPEAEREIPWHAALLSGGACADGVLGGHTLDEGSVYSHIVGLNIAARDPLQHAMPLVYSEPDLALSVLRNTCAWAAPNGFLPWALDGAKNVVSAPMLPENPSDVHLWALWLASEYAIATGDLGAFAEPVGFHPRHGAPPVPLGENLRLQFRHFVDEVGRGPNGHVRLLSCDWSDGFVGAEAAGIDRETLHSEGESVMNSAMAAWVLPRWAHLSEALGDAATAKEARALAEELRLAVAAAWNGRWFRRAYVGDVGLGDDRLFLEPQPWAILCGAATDEQADSLLAEIDEKLRTGSPLGARQQWPLTDEGGRQAGEGLNGGIWFALNAVLVWAAASRGAPWAWDEWRRMTLASHSAAYPSTWLGTLSGPDSYNAPESAKAGGTFQLPVPGEFPTDNMHSHSQPLLAYIRLLGVEPTADGALRVGGGSGAFASRTFAVAPDSTGRLLAAGPVVVEARTVRVQGEAGNVRW